MGEIVITDAKKAQTDKAQKSNKTLSNQEQWVRIQGKKRPVTAQTYLLYTSDDEPVHCMTMSLWLPAKENILLLLLARLLPLIAHTEGRYLHSPLFSLFPCVNFKVR